MVVANSFQFLKTRNFLSAVVYRQDEDGQSMETLNRVNAKIELLTVLQNGLKSKYFFVDIKPFDLKSF